MGTYDLQKIFIHEVGHFIAREMNIKFYEDFNAVEMCIIINKPIRSLRRGGYVESIVSEQDLNVSSQKKKYPNILTLIAYGCIVQESIFKENRFDDCFKTSGQEDFSQFKEGLKNHSTFVEKEIAKCFNIYQDNSIRNKLFDYLIDLQYTDYIKEETDINYIIDIEKLSDHLQDFYKIHELPYKKLVSDIAEILKE